ncbi:MAG: iodotyrosine deiodinase [Candidatus Paceibacteria bacterium]|jgi:iodotyrosine deiodinase
MSESDFIPLDYTRPAPEEMLRRAQDFADSLARRRSVREFSADPLPDGVLDACIRGAGMAPSGANQQPWTFVVVTDPVIKHKIREAAEEEERLNYGGRMNDEWLAALAPLATDAHKEFLETAPALVVLFRQAHGVENGEKHQHYYSNESIGIALGFFIAALHQAGICALTHTPSPMKFLEGILERPENERAYMLLPVGYPASDCVVPDIKRKPLDDIRVQR